MLNEYGQVVQACWDEIPCHFSHVALDAFAVMPNHVHGIIVIAHRNVGTGVGATHASPLPSSSPPHGPQPQSVGAIVGSFKSATTNRINEMRGTPGTPVWQRDYYEHIVRDEQELHRIREYILTNSLRWHLDRENPSCTGVDELEKLLFPDHSAQRWTVRRKGRT
jgi:REP element-mobilizing transposase RayT